MEQQSLPPTPLHPIPPLSTSSPPPAISDASIIILIWKVIQSMRSRGDGNTLDCLLNEQKLLHLTLLTLQKKTLKAPPFDFTLQTTLFIQKINKLTMQSFEPSPESPDSSPLSTPSHNLFIKAIDLLMTRSLGKYITPLRTLGELKVLTFNNLACIYKRKKKLTLALRSVSFALEIEEALVENESVGDKNNIVTTYLNKAAILSEMGKHEKAIDEVNRAMKYLGCLEKELGRQEGEKEEGKEGKEKEKEREERKHYCTYMKMIVFYNLGVENEHLNMRESAEICYKRGKVIAETIGNEVMKKKLTEILGKLGADEKMR